MSWFIFVERFTPYFIPTTLFPLALSSPKKKLAARHLKTGGRVLYDLSSSYFEGTTCPLARRGYNRDGKHGLLQVALPQVMTLGVVAHSRTPPPT